MRKVIVNEFLTLDGVMQAPGLPDEDRSGGFEHGGWQMPLMDDEAGSAITEGLAATGGLLLGRVTYEIFAGFWPNAPADDPLAQTINVLPKYVVSTTLREPLEWNNSHLIKGDVANEVARLKAEPGKDLRVIGSGKRLFREDSPEISLRLVDSKTSKTGVLIVTYEPER